jgi:DNA-binding IscR family transcriptional regulator
LKVKPGPAHPKKRNRAMLALLRKAARQGRNKKTQRFYSIRDVAARFRIAPTTVARMFDQLKYEGIIRSVWGSQTILDPAPLDRQIRIRGVIALLAPVELIASKTDCRESLAMLTHEWWQMGFAPRVWPYDADDAESTVFFKRIMDEKPDAIIWISAGSRTTLLARRLLNCGIRVVQITGARPDAALAHAKII